MLNVSEMVVDGVNGEVTFSQASTSNGTWGAASLKHHDGRQALWRMPSKQYPRGLGTHPQCSRRLVCSLDRRNTSRCSLHRYTRRAHTGRGRSRRCLQNKTMVLTVFVSNSTLEDQFIFYLL